MTEENFINFPPFSGTPITASQVPLREEEQSGLSGIMRGILGPATEPVEGLLSLFDPRDIYKSLEESGQNLKEGVREVDPKKLLLGALGTAAIGAESTPFGKGTKVVDRAIKLKRQGDVPPDKSKPDWKTVNRKKVLTPQEKPIEVAKSLLQGRKDSGEFLTDTRGDPVVVYHSTDSRQPFNKFLTRSERNELSLDPDEFGGYPFVSTSSVAEGAAPYGLNSRLGINTLEQQKLLDAGYSQEEISKGLREGARLIPALVKSNKVFDFENPKHIKTIFKQHDKNIKKELTLLEKVSEEGTSASEKFNSLIKDMSPKQKLGLQKNINLSSQAMSRAKHVKKHPNNRIIPRGKTIFDKKGNILPEFKNNTFVLETLDTFLNRRYKDLTARVNNKQYRKEMKAGLSAGDYSEVEDEHILKAMQDLGFDAFTTFEEGAKNVMLFKPDTQLIPLFDLDKKSTVGFNKGGSVVERNPYNYTARAI